MRYKTFLQRASITAVVAAVAFTAAVMNAVDRAAGGETGARGSGVVVDADVVYRRVVTPDGSTVPLALDVHRTGGAASGRRAAVILVHGGAFSGGSKADMAGYANTFAERGFVVFSIDYRLRPGYDWFDEQARADAARDARADAVAAVEWVRANAEAYGVDPAWIFASGFSAGAIVAFDLAAPAPGEPDAGVAGVAPVAGYANAVPAPGAAPVLAFAGGGDTIIEPRLTTESCAEFRAAGTQCRTVTYRGMQHDFGFFLAADIADAAADFFASIVRLGTAA